MELEFSLDANCRTTYDKNKIRGNENKNNDGKPHHGGKTSDLECKEVDYSCKSVMTSLQDSSNSMSAEEMDKHRSRLDELLFDCEVSTITLIYTTSAL